MLACATASFIPTSRAMIYGQLSMHPSELILIVWVGATWGYFPAFTVLIFARTLPKMLSMLSNSVNVEHGSLHHRVSNTMLVVTVLYCIWLNFSLLTPLGLLEFNPSKVIVTGGFFGARSDPAIAWMGIMIIFPPLYALGFMLYRIGSEIGMSDTLLVFSFFLLSHAASYWSGLFYTEYFVMLTTASMFYASMLFMGGISSILLRVHPSRSMS